MHKPINQHNKAQHKIKYSNNHKMNKDKYAVLVNLLTNSL